MLGFQTPGIEMQVAKNDCFEWKGKQPFETAYRGSNCVIVLISVYQY